MKQLSLLAGILSIISSSYAAPITNNIAGVGPNGSMKPYFCIQHGGKVTYALAPGETVDANRYSRDSNYVGGSLRFNGCSVNDTYLGYAGFHVDDRPLTYKRYEFLSYSQSQGVHITYAYPDINNRGEITGAIMYTPIQTNDNLASAANNINPYWDFVGINLSGLEFSKMLDPIVVPNLSREDANQPRSDLDEINTFIEQGINTVRLPLRWGYLQLDGPGRGEINLEYFDNFVRPTLQTLTAAKVNTMVDLHAYMRYSKFGEGFAGCSGDSKCPDGELVLDSAAYMSVWGKLYQLVKADPKIDENYIMMDLVNEPVDVPGDKVFTIQADVIKMLRRQGFQGYILVEGNSWSGLHSWHESGNAALFTRENFAKAGITDLDKIVINVHQYLDYNYSGTSNSCLSDLTTTGPGGFNLQAFVDYLQQNGLKAMVTEFGGGKDAASCQGSLEKFIDYLKQNSAQGKEYGFLGWTIWSAGHGWGNYHLRVKPDSYHTNVLVNRAL